MEDGSEEEDEDFDFDDEDDFEGYFCLFDLSSHLISFITADGIIIIISSLFGCRWWRWHAWALSSWEIRLLSESYLEGIRHVIFFKLKKNVLHLPTFVFTLCKTVIVRSVGDFKDPAKMN